MHVFVLKTTTSGFCFINIINWFWAFCLDVLFCHARKVLPDLTAAIDAPTWARHDFNKVIVTFPWHNVFNHSSCIPQTANHAKFESSRPRFDICFFATILRALFASPSVKSATSIKISIICSCLPGEEEEIISHDWTNY